MPVKKTKKTKTIHVSKNQAVVLLLQKHVILSTFDYQ